MIEMSDIPIQASADWLTWLGRLSIPALITYIWRNEAKQHRQDLALKDLEMELRETLTHNNDFKELKRTVDNIDRLVRRLAVKQGVSTREDD